MKILLMQGHFLPYFQKLAWLSVSINCHFMPFSAFTRFAIQLPNLSRYYYVVQAIQYSKLTTLYLAYANHVVIVQPWSD